MVSPFPPNVDIDCVVVSGAPNRLRGGAAVEV